LCTPLQPDCRRAPAILIYSSSLTHLCCSGVINYSAAVITDIYDLTATQTLTLHRGLQDLGP